MDMETSYLACGHTQITADRRREEGDSMTTVCDGVAIFFNATPSRSLDNITNHFLPRFVSLSPTIVRSGGGHRTQNLPRAFPVSWFVCGNHALG